MRDMLKRRSCECIAALDLCVQLRVVAWLPHEAVGTNVIAQCHSSKNGTQAQSTRTRI